MPSRAAVGAGVGALEPCARRARLQRPAERAGRGARGHGSSLELQARVRDLRASHIAQCRQQRHRWVDPAASWIRHGKGAGAQKAANFAPQGRFVFGCSATKGHRAVVARKARGGFPRRAVSTSALVKRGLLAARSAHPRDLVGDVITEVINYATWKTPHRVWALFHAAQVPRKPIRDQRCCSASRSQQQPLKTRMRRPCGVEAQ